MTFQTSQLPLVSVLPTPLLVTKPALLDLIEHHYGCASDEWILEASNPRFSLNQFWQWPLCLYFEEQSARTVPELELAQRIQHFVPGKSKIQQPLWERYWLQDFWLCFFFELLANGRRSTIPHMQAANACGCKLEQEEASSSVRTEWQTKSSPTAVLATNLGDSESPSQKLVHHKRALQIKCKPPTKRAHSVRH